MTVPQAQLWLARLVWEDRGPLARAGLAGWSLPVGHKQEWGDCLPQARHRAECFFLTQLTSSLLEEIKYLPKVRQLVRGDLGYEPRRPNFNSQYAICTEKLERKLLTVQAQAHGPRGGLARPKWQAHSPLWSALRYRHTPSRSFFLLFTVCHFCTYPQISRASQLWNWDTPRIVSSLAFLSAPSSSNLYHVAIVFLHFKVSSVTAIKTWYHFILLAWNLFTLSCNLSRIFCIFELSCYPSRMTGVTPLKWVLGNIQAWGEIFGWSWSPPVSPKIILCLRLALKVNPLSLLAHLGARAGTWETRAWTASQHH